MKRRIYRTLGAIAVSAAAALVGTVALLDQAEAAVTGIRNTKHNLGTGGVSGNNQFSGTEEVCVFCHTPHGAATSASNPPLWNRALPTTNPYTLYSSTTMDAVTATDGVGGGAIGSVSLACLTCHDGTQAMNSVINAPGSGTAGSAAWQSGTWTAGTGTPVNTTTGALGDGIANLGTNLSNDHPIGIAYCGWTGTPGATVNCGDSDFNAPATQVIGSTRVWWVETGSTPSVRNKTDMILYNRSFGGTTGPSVECASCHDPHTDQAPTFLRVANTQSAVCLACHIK